VLALMFVVSSVSVAAGAGEPATSADDALDAALEKLVSRRDGPPGIAVVVQRDGEPQLHAAGSADVEAETPPAIDDHIRVASVAKAFSGAAALAAVAEGVLSLDETIGTRLSDLPADWSEVTLAQLLGHTSGIPDFSQTEEFQEAVGASLEVAPPPVELLSYVADDPLEFEPGSEYRYSNSDNIVVGLMLEAATGQPYADVLQARVAVPLGLAGTSLPTGVEMPDPFVHGYAVDPPDPPEDVTELIAAGWSWASGGVVATPADSNAFIRGYASGATTNEQTRSAQLEFVRGGKSEPPGPGRNSAGLRRLTGSGPRASR
jgi:D-alanyl-D-alanine carboxypeptidase